MNEYVSGSERHRLLSCRSLVEAFLRDEHFDVIGVKAVNHTGSLIGGLNYCDRTVTVVITRSSAVKHAKRVDLSVIAKLNDSVAILSFPTISIVHVMFLSLC
jgi:hypothetical protein